MKKFIVAICGVMLACGAWATVNVVDETIKTAWGYSTANSKRYITSDYDIQTNAEYNIQYVDIAAAIEIYDQGAKFCRMRLAHNWGKWGVFIAPGSCITICKDGYYGDKCKYQTFESNWCDNRELTTIFDVKASPAPYQEKSIDGFYSWSNDTIVLQILSVKSHGIEVAPVEYYDKDSTNKIGSINTRGQGYILCAPGYKQDSQTGECKQMPSCCGNKKETYTDNQGVCRECPKDTMFNGEECKAYKSLKKLDLVKGIQGLFDCWREIGSAAYKECVKCPGGWEKDQKRCFI